MKNNITGKYSVLLNVKTFFIGESQVSRVLFMVLKLGHIFFVKFKCKE